MSDLKQFNLTIANPRTQEYLGNVLANKKDSFVNNITALVSNNKALQECEPMSVMYAGIKATALDLPLDANLGLAYVIPYKNKDKVEAQFQIGYKGLIQLAIRSGQFKTINVTEVKEGELKEFDLLTGEIKFEAAQDRAKRKTIGYVAYFRLTNGFEKTMYSTVDEITEHAKKFSKTFAFKGGVWQTNFDAMAKKTILKNIISHYAPLSVDMQQAITSDQATINKDMSANYVDNGNSPKVEETEYRDVTMETPQDAALQQQEQQPMQQAQAQAQVQEPVQPQPAQQQTMNYNFD